MILDHALERIVLIAARPATVFRFFTDPARFAVWWGAGSHIDARPGGAVHHPLPERRRRVGRGGGGGARPAHRLHVRLRGRGQAHPAGRLAGDGDARGDGAGDAAPAPPRVRDRRGPRRARPGLALPARHLRERGRGGAARRDRRAGDAFFAAWAEPDAALRREALAEVVTDDVTFQDAFACTAGLDDLVAHTGAVQMHMPGVLLARAGNARYCQGTAVVEWEMQAADGTARGRGTNVFDLAPDGRIAAVVGVRAS